MEENDEVDQSLNEFRSKWQNELNERRTQKNETEGEESSESLAAKLFMSAVELERKFMTLDYFLRSEDIHLMTYDSSNKLKRVEKDFINLIESKVHLRAY